MHRVLLLLVLASCNRAEQDRMIAANRPQPSSSLGEWVQGNDGTIGWRTGTRGAKTMFKQVSERVAKSCSVEARTDAETRASCNGITILVRQDATDLYRVCAKGTTPEQCLSAWNAIQ